MNYLWFDCETGGLDANNNSLLTAYFAVCNRNLEKLDDLYLQLKPSDLSRLNVEESALKVNKINIKNHLEDPNTLTYEEGYRALLTFLEKNKIKEKHSFQPCGHNIDFDKPFIWNQLMPQKIWEKNVHYRTLDTSSATTFLKDTGIFPQELGSLTSLVEYFKIPMGEAHNARGDVLMNIEVYKSMRLLIGNMKKNSALSGGNASSSLLEIIED